MLFSKGWQEVSTGLGATGATLLLFLAVLREISAPQCSPASG